MILIFLLLFTGVLFFIALYTKQRWLSILLGIAFGGLLLLAAAAAYALWVISASGL
jgi:hypothetical protein